ncbi:MAG TPA: helix-turn-helix domain-containing protein [Pseudolabrys sp.]|jgi:AcrR family transcriptional regulator|nr:helix-turn-helix domain-containing protein [Pseudolabrys sp.]
MPRSAEATWRRIIDAAYRAFRRRGYSRIGVDDIAAAARVTKRTLYYHFKSKDALLAAVLESQYNHVAIGFDALNKSSSNDAGAIIAGIFTGLTEWASGPRWSASGFTRVAMELADLPGHPARVIAKRHKAHMEKHLATMFSDCGVAAARELAREVWLLAEGAMIMILIHGDVRYSDAAAAAARKLLAASGRKRRGK